MSQVIEEECNVFSGDDNDIGDIRSHPMKINLKDDRPVQVNYNSVPRHLYIYTTFRISSGFPTPVLLIHHQLL